MTATSIATQVEAHHRLEYAASVSMVAQQKKNPLADTVISVPAKGEAMSAADLIGAVEYQYGEDRSRRNPEIPPFASRRWLIRPPVIEWGMYIDQEDKFDSARDPTSSFVTAGVTAVRRGRMDRILGVRKQSGAYVVVDGGILGSAIDGKRPGSSGTALPAGQILAVGSTGMSIEKIRAAKLLLKQADFGVEDDDPLYCLISPLQEDDLIAIAQASGTALNTFNVEQLKSGKASPLMGISWIVSNRVPKDANGDWMNPVWAKSNVVEGVWQDTQGDMWNDTHAKNKPYAYVSAYADVVRLQDTGVVVITSKHA